MAVSRPEGITVQHSEPDDHHLPNGIRLDANAGEYLLELDGMTAVLRFRELPNDVVDLYSTFVPPEARGRGMAGRLVGAALDHLRAEGKRIVPTCSYLGTYLDRHPEARDLVA